MKAEWKWWALLATINLMALCLNSSAPGWIILLNAGGAFLCGGLALYEKKE